MIGETGEIFDWFKAAFAGWRYVFSKAYRKEKHENWKNEKRIYIIWDFILGTAGIAFSIVVIYVIYSLAYQ